jgi:hypothetical protein
MSETCSWMLMDEGTATFRKKITTDVYTRAPLTHKSMYPVSKEFLRLLPITPEQSLLHTIIQHERTASEGFL